MNNQIQPKALTEIEAAQYICMSRSFLAQARMDGNREPHHDGTPHWHMLFFMPPNQVTQKHLDFNNQHINFVVRNTASLEVRQHMGSAYTSKLGCKS